MNPLKKLIGFGWKFLLFYIVFFVLASTTGCDNKVRDMYASVGNSTFKNLSKEAEISGLVHEDREKNTNVLFQIHNKERLNQIRQEMMRTGQTNINVETLGMYSSSHTTVLMPFILLLSLILAYPSSISRKLGSIAISIPLFFMYLYIKVGGSLIYTIDNSQYYFPQYELSGFMNKSLEVINNLIIDGAYIVVVLIWFVASVRIDDFHEKSKKPNLSK